MPTSELIAPYRCPAVLARKAASARARPGRTCRARRRVLRGPNFVDCPSPSRRAARPPRPGRRLCTARGAQRTPAEAQQPATRGAASLAPPLPVTARPRPPALSPFPGCFCRQALDRLLPAACFIFQDVSRQRMSAFPAVTVKCLWILKSSILFLDPEPEIP